MVAQCWIDRYVSHFSLEDCIGHVLFILNVSSTQLIIVLVDLVRAPESKPRTLYLHRGLQCRL